MANEILSSTPNKTTTIRKTGEVNVNVKRLADALLPIANTTLVTDSTETFLLDAFEKLFSRVRTLEGESDEHESVLKRVGPCISRDEADFEVLIRVSEVKSIVSKRLYHLDPESADTIWRAVDSIQQLITPIVSKSAMPVELTTTRPM